MRPRKIILLIDADQERQSLTRYLLRTYSYGVVSLSSVKDASEMTGPTPDCVLGFWPLEADIADAFARMYAIAFVLVMPTPEVLTGDVFCSRALIGDDCSPADILDAVSTACARKRGPVSASMMAASKEAAEYLGVA